MENRMAIWTNRPEILDRINLVIASNAREWPKVMYVNKS